MPKFDETGPQGQGPMTGRGAGPCNPAWNNTGRGFGRGSGRGIGFGKRLFGWCPWWDQAQPAQMNPTDEKAALEEERNYAEEDLKAIDERLKELKNRE